MLTSASSVLLTGATGLIGGELMKALLATPLARLWAMARPGLEGGAAVRLLERLGKTHSDLNGLKSLLRPVTGDVTQSDLGLTPKDVRDLLAEVNVFIHCAADTSFIRHEDCRRTNVGGMKHLIALARRCAAPPLVVYVSTAANCGAVQSRCLSEEGAEPQRRHFNEYTRSKAEAEDLLRQSGLPVLIVRPSIVLSAGLQDARFAMSILWCLPVLNSLDAAPVHPASRLDFVTVEFVVGSLLKLLQLPARRHACYHLSAGAAGSVTCGRVAEFLDQYYNRDQPLQLFPPAEWTAALSRRFVQTRQQRTALARLQPYLPFLNMNTVFDNRRLTAELADATPHNPDPLSYMATLLRQFSSADSFAAACNP